MWVVTRHHCEWVAAMSDDPADRTDSTTGSDRDATDGNRVDGRTDRHFEIHELSTLVDDCAVAPFGPDGRVNRWNDGARRLTGYDAETIVGAHYRTFFPPDARESDRPERVLERARSNGTAETEGWRLRDDGDRIRVHEVVAPVREDDEIGVPVDRPVELAGYVWLVHDRTEDYERERTLREETAFAESVFEAQPDIVYAFDADENHLEWNERVRAVTGYTDAELAEMEPLEFVAPEDRDRIAGTIRRLLEVDEYVTAEADLVTKDGRRIPYEFNSARITDDDGAVLGFTGTGRDISDRKARERELERLERLNAIVRTIDETVVAAETRDEIEQAIVEEFAAADAYRFAAIGRTEPAASTAGYSWEPTARAGIDTTAVDGVLPSFVEPPADAPGVSPFETRSTQRYRHLHESPIDEWRADARERGYGSVAVVPIVATDRAFGALVVAAAEPSAFADREREILQEFGGTVGHAINAMAVRRLLYLDTVVELEFESTDAGDSCIALSHGAGCDLSVDHVLPLTDEVFVYYLTVSDIDPDAIRAVARDTPSITELRLIDAADDESDWEVVVRDATVAGLLGEYGARLQSQVVHDGIAELTVHVSLDTDLRDLVGAITSTYPDTELVSKRTIERPIRTHGDFRRTVESILTEKQRLALEAAYHGGYFEWPTRNSDASEIADRLDIARQTFHQHLRVAQAKLLSAYFGARNETTTG